MGEGGGLAMNLTVEWDYGKIAWPSCLRASVISSVKRGDGDGDGDGGCTVRSMSQKVFI